METAIIDDIKLSDDASAELRSIRQKITRSGLKIRETLDKMIKSPSTQKYLQESIVTMRDGRFVLPVKLSSRAMSAVLFMTLPQQAQRFL